ncbi:hypothetical protein [Hyphococcus sp.]|uniref:hypothetical protein n=1 Tax=Hyphococcus sp. TaxID=2038636 RepID=UPI0035C758E1
MRNSFVTILFSAALMAGSASAGDLYDACAVAVDNEGQPVDPAGCECLESEADGDTALVEELIEIANTAPEDRAPSEDAADAIAACFS